MEKDETIQINEKSGGNVPFFNRELSWIEFNRRVLEEAFDESVPLLERLKFVSIVAANFNEFFMVRVATIKRHIRQGNKVRCPSGITPSQLLSKIEEKVKEIIARKHDCLENDFIPALRENGIIYVDPRNYSMTQQRAVEQLFDQEIYLTLTPVRVEQKKEFPFTNNLSMNFLYKMNPVLEDEDEGPHYSIVQIPSVLSRIHWLPGDDENLCFTFLEDIIVNNSEKLFPGYKIVEYLLFRVTRDADLSVDEERDEDFVEAMEELLIDRQRSRPVRLETVVNSESLLEMLKNELELNDRDIYILPRHLDLSCLADIAEISDFDSLRYEKWKPRRPADIPEDAYLWDILKRRDALLHHPYESFDPVINLINDAAEDPQVLAIKMTLYRTSGESPIIKALIKAAENGKQVAVMVELKARFDEERNIGWASQLERAGVIVVYGIAHLKVHSKALMIVRKETEGIKRYVQLGTGNYNDKTAKLYTDFSFLTTREDITLEVAQFFNAVTGYSSVPNLKKLVMAPIALKNKLLFLINRETERSTPHTPGRIMAKMNSLSDPDIIRALYEASQNGVKIELNVRGICMLVPGIKELSETISVVSIVDRYLEHSRIFYFYNMGDPELFLASADWMPRNLERRVELMFPVESERLKKSLVDTLKVFLSDNVKAKVLQPDGSYKKREMEAEGRKIRAQKFFYEAAVEKERKAARTPTRDFSVRRTPPDKNL